MPAVIRRQTEQGEPNKKSTANSKTEILCGCVCNTAASQMSGDTVKQPVATNQVAPS